LATVYAKNLGFRYGNNAVSVQVADDEYEGLYTVTIEHSFDSGN